MFSLFLQEINIGTLLSLTNVPLYILLLVRACCNQVGPGVVRFTAHQFFQEPDHNEVHGIKDRPRVDFIAYLAWGLPRHVQKH